MTGAPDGLLRVELRRSGGVTGATLFGSLPAAAVDPTELAALADLTRLHPPPTAGADRFSYEISLVTDAGAHRTIVPESALPDAVLPLVERLLEQARSR